VVWGTTYFAIAIALDSVAPFSIAALRFGLATLIAAVLLVIQRPGLKGIPIIRSLVSGVLFGGMGNGFVIFAQQGVPSGIAALVVTTVPVVVLLLDWLGFSKRPPGPRAALGLLLALIGVAAIIAESKGFSGPTPFISVGFLLAAVLAWSIGTLLLPGRTRADQLLGVTFLQMIGGMLFALLMSFVNNEWTDGFVATLSAVNAAGLWAIVYLAVFGSIVTQNCYVWLLTHQPAPKVATYALVNPVVAVLLGTLVLKEPITGTIIVGSALVLVGVALVLFRRFTQG